LSYFRDSLFSYPFSLLPCILFRALFFLFSLLRYWEQTAASNKAGKNKPAAFLRALWHVWLLPAGGNSVGFFQRTALMGRDGGIAVSELTFDWEKVKGQRRSNEPAMDWTLRTGFRM